MEREKEKKRPCLRLNYPEDGKCNECVKGVCRYDRICFMCGNEGHGASQSFPGGKMKGKLKCVKHRNCLNQLSAIKSEHGMDDEDLKVLFQEDESLNKLSVNTSPKLNAHGNSVASSNSIGVISPPSSVSGSPSASSESYQPRSNIIVQGIPILFLPIIRS